MKNSGGGFKTIAVIAFLVISLFAANSFILNSDFRGGFQPRLLKSITNYIKNENTQQDKFDISDGVEPNDEQRGSALSDDVSPDDPDSERDKNSANSKSVKASQSSVVTSGASGKVVIEQSSKRVLYGENQDEKCFPASTTKILTAYIALMNLPLDHVVTVPKQAEGVEGSSIYLRAGDKITVEDLLYGLMLRSGNDSATALAIEVSGSVEAFAELMNVTATQLGAKNSHFTNPHGLHDDDHYVTPHDLALITAAAYELDDFKRIVSSTVHTITVSGTRTAIANKNKLLKLFDGANGAKTGYTKRSGRCLVGGAYREGMQLISVVLNCPDMWNDTAELLNRGFDNFDMVPLDHALLRSVRGGNPVQVCAPYNVTSDWRDVRYPLAEDEYPVISAA